MDRTKIKVAILGGSICGLACAIELERNGIVPIIFERDTLVSWVFPSVSFVPYAFYNKFGNPRKYLLEQYKVDFAGITEINSITMKSPNNEVKIEGNLGYTIHRGNVPNSLGYQLQRQLTQTAIHYCSKEDYKNLSKEYDYVVIATGKESEARELGVWEDEGIVNIIGAHIIGSFNPASANIYFNTEYAGTGYGRVTPFNSQIAVVGLYIMGTKELGELDTLKCLRDFIRREKLDNNEYVLRYLPPPFTTGRVTKFKIDNILLAGRSAGLTERVLGCGGFEALASGVLSARAIITGDDYDTMMKPLQNHVENISSFRKIIDGFNNDDFDKLVSALKIPGVKQIIYNTGISFADIVGNVAKTIQKENKG